MRKTGWELLRGNEYFGDGQWKTLMETAEKDYQELIKTYRQDYHELAGQAVSW